MASLPEIIAIQATDAPQHAAHLRKILQKLKTENRINGFTALSPDNDLSSVSDTLKKDDMILILLTREFEGKREQIKKRVSALKSDQPGLRVAEILVDNLIYDNDYITFPTDLKPIRDRKDMDEAWSSIGRSLRNMFPVIEPESDPEKEKDLAGETVSGSIPKPVWVVLAVLAVILLGWLVLDLISPPDTDLVSVPDVAGETVEEAVLSLREAGLQVGERQSESSNTVEEELVIRTDPRAGSSVEEEFPIDLHISTGPEREQKIAFHEEASSGPDDVSQSPNYKTVLTKSVPAGSYVVKGKVVVSDTEDADPFPATVRCTMFSGNSVVDTYPLRMGGPGSGYGATVFTLQGVVRATGSSTELSIRCRKGGNDTTSVRVGENPKLTALRVGEDLFHEEASSGPDDMSQSPNYTTVLTESVPAGSYVVKGKVVVSDTEDADPFPATVRCTMFSGNSVVDTYPLRMGGPGSGYGAKVFTLQGVVRATGSSTELSIRCRKGGNDTTSVRVGENPKLTAIRVGRDLFHEEASSGPDDMSQSPNYTTVLTESVPAGNYVVKGKVVVSDTEDTDPFPATVRCTMFSGNSVVDTYPLRMGSPGSGYGATVFTLQGVIRATGSSTELSIRCRKGGNDTTSVRVGENPKLTAIRVGDIR